MDIPYLLQHPEELDQETLYDLRRIVAVYPTYHAARILFLQNLFLLHDPTFDQELRRAALLVPDRRVLYNITQPLACTTQPATVASILTTAATPATDLTTAALATTDPEGTTEGKSEERHQEDDKRDNEKYAPTGSRQTSTTTLPPTSRPLRKKYASNDSTSRLLDNFLSTSNPLPKRRIKADPSSDYMAYIMENGESFGTAPDMDANTGTSAVGNATQNGSTPQKDTRFDPANTSTSSKEDRMDSLISGFINSYAEGGITLAENPEIPEEVTSESEVSNDPTLTETLANIYIQQQKYERAIEVLTKSQAQTSRNTPYLADQVRFLQKLAINERHKNRKK